MSFTADEMIIFGNQFMKTLMDDGFRAYYDGKPLQLQKWRDMWKFSINNLSEYKKTATPEKDTWVQCKTCGKWRKLPAGITEYEGDFECRNNNWDLRFNRCDIEEEPEDGKLPPFDVPGEMSSDDDEEDVFGDDDATPFYNPFGRYYSPFVRYYNECKKQKGYTKPPRGFRKQVRSIWNDMTKLEKEPYYANKKPDPHPKEPSVWSKKKKSPFTKYYEECKKQDNPRGKLREYKKTIQQKWDDMSNKEQVKWGVKETKDPYTNFYNFYIKFPGPNQPCTPRERSTYLKELWDEMTDDDKQPYTKPIKTGYSLFTSKRRGELKKAHPELPHREITKRLGSEWKSLSVEEKNTYV